jgi:hypothetical protein
MSGSYIRGALVEFMPTVLVPLPNVIIFQYNPETVTHTWTQPASAGVQGAEWARGISPRAPHRFRT